MLHEDPKDPYKAIILFPGQKADDVVEMLRCVIRTGTETKPIDSTNLDPMLYLANQYAIDFLMHKCKSYLIEKAELVKEMRINEQEIFKTFIKAVQYKFKEIVRRLLLAVARFGANGSEMFTSTLKLSPQVRCAIYAQMAGNVAKHEYEAVCTQAQRKTWQPHMTALPNFKCKFCGFIACWHCRDASYQSVKGFQVRCFACRKCLKSTFFWDEQFEGRDADKPFNGYQCLHEAAVVELEKIGL